MNPFFLQGHKVLPYWLRATPKQNLVGLVYVSLKHTVVERKQISSKSVPICHNTLLTVFFRVIHISFKTIFKQLLLHHLHHLPGGKKDKKHSICLRGRDRQERIRQRQGTSCCPPQEERGLGHVASLSPPPPGQGGYHLYHGGEESIRGAYGQTARRESQHLQI